MSALPVQLVRVASSANATGTLPPPQPPLAVAVPVLLVKVDSPHCNCRSSGQTKIGAPPSVTVTASWQVLLLQLVASVTSRLKVNEPGLVAVTAIVCVLVAPLMEPSPEMDQLYEVRPDGPA